MRIILLFIAPLVLLFVCLYDRDRVWEKRSALSYFFIAQMLPIGILLPVVVAALIPTNQIGIIGGMLVLIREVIVPAGTIYICVVRSMNMWNPYTQENKKENHEKLFLHLLYLFLSVYNIGRFFVAPQHEQVGFSAVVSPIYSLFLPIICMVLLEAIGFLANRGKLYLYGHLKKDEVNNQKTGKASIFSRNILLKLRKSTFFEKNIRANSLDYFIFILVHCIFVMTTSQIFHGYSYGLFTFLGLGYLVAVYLFWRIRVLSHTVFLLTGSGLRG